MKKPDLYLLAETIRHEGFAEEQAVDTWIGTSMQPPTNVERNRSFPSINSPGGVYFNTEFGLSFAATVAGADRFTRIVEQFDEDKNQNALGYLASLQGLKDVVTPDFNLYNRQSLALDRHRGIILSLGDIVKVLPVTEQADETVRAEVLARLESVNQ